MSMAAQPGRQTAVAEPVLLLSRTLGHGGTERQLAEMAKSLDRQRYIPHVACVDGTGFRAKELQEQGVSILELPMRSLMSRECMAAIWKLRGYLRQHRIRLLHAFDSPMNAFAIPAARILGVPVALSSQRCYEDVIYPKQRGLVRFAHRISHGVVVNCEAVRDHVRTGYGIPEERVHLCYNGLDTSIFHTGGRKRPEALAGASVVVGVICVLRPEKSVITLVEAFARLRQSDERAQLLIVGSGPELEALRERAGALGILESCLFEPSTDDVRRWLWAIDIFVLPSLSEAFSNSLMESMACGCTPVASRVGGNPELVRPGETGLLFEKGDADDLARQLQVLAADPALRQRLADQGAAWVSTQLSLQCAAQRMQEIYDSHLQRAGR